MQNGTTIYPYGTGGQLPSSIGVINDLITGGADKALSAQMGKELNEYVTGIRVLEQVSLVKPQGESQLYITGSGKWAVYKSYNGTLIQVVEGEKYLITAGANGAYYALVKSADPSNIVDEESVDFSDGCTIEYIDANGSALVSVPSDAAYLYIALQDSTNRTPLSVLKVAQYVNGLLVNDLTTGGTNKALSAEQGKVLKGMLYGFAAVDLPAATSIFIATTTNKWAVNYNQYKGIMLQVSSGDTYRIKAKSGNYCYYAFLKNDSAVDGNTPDYTDGYYAALTLDAGDSVDVVVPTNATHLYISSYGSSDLSPQGVERLQPLGQTVQEINDAIADKQLYQFPTLLKLGEPTNIIYTIDDFLMAHEYDENNNINQFRFSNDLGETWTSPVENIWGELVNIFMFADGTLIFAGYKADAGCRWYWTRDFDTFSECTVIDYNGAFVPVAGERRFGEIQAKTHHVYVNGTEYYCFGDYIINCSHPRVWYAISNVDGVTIRCAFAFGYQSIDDVVVPARHYHSFDYNPYDGKFYALTGDNDTTECNILRGTHDENHVWTWERVAFGPRYKLASIRFDEGNMYAITDYTSSSLTELKGVLSMPINEINYERFRYWFKPSAQFMLEGSHYGNSKPAALSASVVDNHGWRVLGTDYAGNSKLLIAKGDHNYVWVNNAVGVKLKGWIGPNNKGDVYVWWYTPGFSVNGDDWVKFSHRTTYNFTEIMRQSGATDFFEGWKGTVM